MELSVVTARSGGLVRDLIAVGLGMGSLEPWMDPFSLVGDKTRRWGWGLGELRALLNYLTNIDLVQK